MIEYFQPNAGPRRSRNRATDYGISFQTTEPDSADYYLYIKTMNNNGEILKFTLKDKTRGEEYEVNSQRTNTQIKSLGKRFIQFVLRQFDRNHHAWLSLNKPENPCFGKSITWQVE